MATLTLNINENVFRFTAYPTVKCFLLAKRHLHRTPANSMLAPSHFTYENHDRYFNLASVESLRDNLVYLFTFSKAYAMNGWRLGYMVLPAALKNRR